MADQPSRQRWFERGRRSLKARLVAVFVLLALCTMAVFLAGSERLLKTGWDVYLRPLARDYAEHLTRELGTPPDPARARAIAQRLPVAVRIEGPTVNFQTHTERFKHRYDRRHDHGDSALALSVRSADGHRVRFALVAPPDVNKPRYVGWATLAALLVLTALAYAAVYRQLRPLTAITEGVQAYGRGDFAKTIAVRRNDELGDLATRINSMATSLHGMLDAKRALLLAMSHELRSPLTRARVNAELLDESAERQALLRDLGEMRDLITSLLEGERLTTGHSALQTDSVDLVALLHEAAAADKVAHPNAVAATLEISPGTHSGRADATRLRLLLRNLLDNARRHGPSARAPELFLRQGADGKRVLGVRDYGQGVPPDQLPLLAQAFYRPDSARTRASGGVGLGLYLCRLVAQAHGGELRLRNAEPGLEVAMVWS